MLDDPATARVAHLRVPRYTEKWPLYCSKAAVMSPIESPQPVVLEDLNVSSTWLTEP